MSEPTNQLILDALSANQLALNALLEEAATSGQWAAQGDIYLNGYKIIGGNPDDDTVDKTVEIQGQDINVRPDPQTGQVTAWGLRTPQLVTVPLSASTTMAESNNGSVYVVKTTSDDDPVVITLPALSDYSGEEGQEDVVRNGAFYAQVFNFGSGDVSFATTGGNEFLRSGVASSDPVAVDPGKAAICLYAGNGQWGVV